MDGFAEDSDDGCSAVVVGLVLTGCTGVREPAVRTQMSQAFADSGGAEPAIFSHTMIDEAGITGDTNEGRAFLRERVWQRASIHALVELLRGELTARTIGGDADGSDWDEALKQTPVLAAEAWLAVEQRYELWNTEPWPESLHASTEDYHLVVIAAALGTDTHLASHIAELWNHVEAIEPVNITPPEGLPFRTAPEVVRDPEKRAEYAARLEKERQSKELVARFREAVNVQAFYRRAMEYNIAALITRLEPAAREKLITGIHAKSEGVSPLWELAQDRLKSELEGANSP